LPPVSTAYCSLSLAPPPDSVRNQPVIVRLFVVEPATFECVPKFWVYAAPSVVRLIPPQAACAVLLGREMVPKASVAISKTREIIPPLKPLCFTTSPKKTSFPPKTFAATKRTPCPKNLTMISLKLLDRRFSQGCPTVGWHGPIFAVEQPPV